MTRSAALALLALALPAHALDVELDSDTSFQAYEVRSPGTGAFMARRRLLSVLGLRASQSIGDPEPDGRQLRVIVEARLRIDQDFGDTCLVDRSLCVRATDSHEPGAWQPLARDTLVDAPAVYAEINGLPLGLTARLGRQLVFDDIGFARFDGLRLTLAPHPWIRAETYGGLLVRSTTLGGTDRSEPQGSIRLDVDQSLVPFSAPPAETWVVGAAVEGGPGPWLRARAAIRHAWEQDGQVISRVAIGLTSAPAPWARAEVGGVLDLLSTEVIDARAGLSLGDDALGMRVTADRRVPRFDPGTIWAYFTVAPIAEMRIGGHMRVSPWLEIAGGLRGRRAELQPGEDVDAGADGSVRAIVEGIRIDLNGFGWTGSLGPLAGVDLAVTRRIFQFLELAGSVSVWHLEDPLRPQNSGTVLSEVLSSRFRISPESSLYLELQHATSQEVGHRFRGIVALRVDTWR